jgi:hypothetical protein
MWSRGGVTFVSYLASLFANGTGKLISKNNIATLIVPPQTHDLCQNQFLEDSKIGIHL